MSTQISVPIFQDQQVLTSFQLNELRDFLDEEHRLTRTSLIGIGVGYGLNVTYLGHQPVREVAVSCGIGVTSEGYLVKLAESVHDRYIPYAPPVSVPYLPFMGTSGVDVTLYEMLTTGSPSQTGEVTFNATTLNLNDMIVMIFVECAEIDNNSCLGRSCDTFGLERKFTVRKLLVSKTDFDKIYTRSTGLLGDPLYGQKFSLTDSIMRRTRFDATLPHSQNYTNFSLNYATTFRSDIFPNVLSEIQQTYTVYQSLLEPIYGLDPFSDPALTARITTWTNYLNGSSTGPAYLGMQYFYDFVKDLILGYDEFCAVAFELASECCINQTRFPRHLAIGELSPAAICGPSKYRQEFIYARLQDHQKQLYEEAILLHKRLVLLMLSFDLSRVNDPVAANTLTYITPSFEKRSLLSERAIPFYYDILNSFPFTSLADAEYGLLPQYWNYDLVRKCKAAIPPVPIPSYGYQDPNQLSDQGPLLTPLYYNLDRYNFLRIEGILRLDYVTVLARINDMKHRFDLPFNVVALRLQGAPYDVVEDRCNFEDLRSQYATLRSKFKCMATELCVRVSQQNNPGSFVSHVLGTDANAVSGNASVALTPPATNNLAGDLITVDMNLVMQDANNAARQFVDNSLSTFEIAPEGDYIAVVAYPGTLIEDKSTPLQILVNDYRRFTTDFCNRLGTLTNALLPFDFKQFNYGADTANRSLSFIKTYLDTVSAAISCKFALNRILDFISRNTKTHFTPEFYFMFQHYANESLAMYNNFMEDCTYKEFEHLYYTYRYRVNWLRTNDPTLFSNFIKKHPGVDHQAGVPKGGTFIIVYNGDPISVSVPARDEVIQIQQNIVDLRCREQVLIAKPSKSKGELFELNHIQFQLNQCFEISASLVQGTAVTIQQLQIEGHQVIADFALPYLCCCDCDCAEIPAPTEADLKLPTNIAVPTFLQFNPGDLAYGRTINASMRGCASPASTMTIDLRTRVTYDTTAGNVFRMKLIQNGVARTPLTVPADSTNVLDSITTAAGGRVDLVWQTGGNHVLKYTPLAGFVGVDSFLYLFEVYSGGTKKLSSTTGQVFMTVTGQCNVSQQNTPTEAINPL